MSGLDVFALLVLFVLLVAAVAGWVVLGMTPGRIARARNHPQAEAINVAGWWGVVTMGLLLPLAWIWAYTNPTEAAPAAQPSVGAEDTDS
jgi:hypothetical protein